MTGKSSLRSVGGPALIASAVAVFAVFCQLPASGPDPVPVAINVLASATFALVGCLIAREPRMAALGGCLVLSGLLWASRWLYTWDRGVWPFLSFEGQVLFWAPITCAVITYPTAAWTPGWNASFCSPRSSAFLAAGRWPHFARRRSARC